LEQSNGLKAPVNLSAGALAEFYRDFYFFAAAENGQRDGVAGAFAI
jgi:hypothetical protein